ncbi:MAG: signal transduction histidine kinase [Bacteroidetes bacterium]|nr:signal transduction histidine kinase [Bacteroidota bacterium]
MWLIFTDVEKGYTCPYYHNFCKLLSYSYEEPAMLKKLSHCLLLSFVLLLITGGLNAQNNDSLLSVYHNKTLPDSTRLKAINDQARFYLNVLPDSSELFAKEGLKLAQDSKQKKWESRLLNTIGLSFFYRGNYPASLDYYFRSLKIREELGDKPGIAASLNNIGGVYGYLSENARALDYYLRALKIAEEVKDKYVIANTLGNIGIIYHELHDTACARIKISQKQKYLLAMDYTLRGMKVAQAEGDSSGVAISYGNLGGFYSGMPDSICRYFNIAPSEKYTKALEYQTKCLQLKEGMGHTQDVAFTLSNIGNLYLSTKEYKKALDFANKSFRLAKEVEDVDTERDVQLLFYKTYKAMGEPAKALTHYELYAVLRDSIFREENKQEITRMEMKYLYDKKAAQDSVRNADEQLVKDAEIAMRDSELKEERSRLYNIIGLALFLLVTVTLVLNQRRSNQKRKSLEEKQVLLKKINHHQEELFNALLSGQEEERKRIAVELHDGLGGLLSTVKLNLDTYSNRLKNEQDKADVLKSVALVDEVCADLRTISHNMMPGVLVKLGLVSATKDYLEKVNASGSLKIHFETYDMEERLNEITEIALFRVLQEATNNIIKHAKATKAGIQFIRHDASLTIMIEDNGSGFDRKKTGASGMGLKSIESRVSYLGGKVIFDSQPGRGTSIIIELPYKTGLN